MRKSYKGILKKGCIFIMTMSLTLGSSSISTLAAGNDEVYDTEIVYETEVEDTFAGCNEDLEAADLNEVYEEEALVEDVAEDSNAENINADDIEVEEIVVEDLGDDLDEEDIEDGDLDDEIIDDDIDDIEDSEDIEEEIIDDDIIDDDIIEDDEDILDEGDDETLETEEDEILDEAEEIEDDEVEYYGEFEYDDVDIEEDDSSDLYSADWQSWAQSTSAYSQMRSGGCRIVAYAKCLRARGFDISDPDAFYRWGIGKGYYTSSSVYENAAFGIPLKSYITASGGTCSISSKYDYNEAAIMNALRAGNDVILTRPTANGWTMHTMYVSRDLSIQQGTPVTLDGASKKVVKNQGSGYATAYRIFYINGGGGTPAPTESWYEVKNAPGGLVLNSGDNYSSEMCVMPNGSKVKYLGTGSGTRYKVQYWNKIGYCSKNYLTGASAPDMSPEGAFDYISSPSGKTIYISGWAFDRDNYESQLQIHVYEGSTYLGSLTANGQRTDVSDAFPGVGSYHGFAGELNVGLTGSHTITLYAINVGSGSNKCIGSKTVNIQNCYSVDLNAMIDGEKCYDLSAAGIVDVYVNGNLVSANVNDYYNTNVVDGTSFLIKNIRAKDGYVYEGVASGSTAFTATGDYEIVLKFSKYTKPVINTQPKSITTSVGGKLKFSVKATGSNLKYEWQYRYYASSKWNKWGTGATFTSPTKASLKMDGMKVRCKITDGNGNKVYTKEKGVYVVNAPKIKTQPKNITVKSGKKVTLKVTADGSGLKYQWQYRKKGASSWTNWGTGRTFTTGKAKKSWNNREYRCVITDRYGQKKTTSVKTIKVK